MKKPKEITNKNPFKVPDNYFEDVNRRIISLTSGFEPGVKRVSIFNRFRTSLLIAASIAGFILISYNVAKFVNHGKIDSQVSEILNEVNPDSYLNDIDLSSLEENASAFILSEEGPRVTKTDIIDYLMLDNIELNEIYTQL
jgi:hypothetical protein